MFKGTTAEPLVEFPLRKKEKLKKTLKGATTGTVVGLVPI